MSVLLERRYRLPGIVVLTTVLVLLATQVFPHSYPLGVLAKGAILGISSGLLALGLVLVYRTSRVMNFAYGAMGSCAAEFGIAAFDVWHWSWLACVAIALVAGAVVGLVVDRVMRRFANAPRLVVTVATIGLLQILVGIQFAIAFWSHARLVVAPFKTNLSAHSFNIGTSLFDFNDVMLVVLAPIALGGLAWFLLRTDSGSAVRAVADNSERAALLGIPIWRLTRIVWILVGALAAVVMILSAPANGLPVNPFVGVGGLFMPALAAAIIAKMDDMPLAVTAGTGLGVFHSIVAYNVHKASVSTVALLVIVLVALLGRRWDVSRAEAAESSWSLSGAARPLRPDAARLPEVRIGRAVLLVLLAVVAIVFPLVAAPARTHTVSGYLVYGIVVVSLVVLSGWAGTISLGQVAIVGVGAVVAGDAIVKLNLDLFAAVVLAGICGAVVSVLIGLPALRVRPLFLAVTTLLFAAAMDNFVLNPANFPKWIPGNIVRPVLWKRYPMGSERTMYFVILAVLGVAIVLARVLRAGRPGRLLLATRDNARAATAMAIPVVRTRVAGMAVAGAIAGVAGALAAVLETGVGASSFPTQTSVLVFSMAVVGGLSSVAGALAGVAAVELLIFAIGLTTSAGAAFGGLGTGALMLFVLLAFPGGIGQFMERVRDRYVGFVARHRGLELTVGAAAGSLDVDTTSVKDERPIGAPILHRSEGAKLACRGITASYGPLQVLFGVDLDVHEQEVVALLGTNGAGKSTVFRVITGLLPATGGEVELNGQRITGLATDEIARRGLAMMPGGRGVFPTMSVRENLRLACWQIRKDTARADAATEEMLAMFPILRERGDQLAGNLSGGEQQQLSLAMAFITKPSVLLIDELSLGLAPTIVAMLCEKVRAVHAAGTTIVAVEQSVNVALELASRAVFLEKGAVRFVGNTLDLFDRPDILRSVFIGDTAATTTTAHDRDDEAPSRDVGLTVQEITKTFGGIRALDGASIDVRPGTIVGLIGHNGAGKTTLFDVISGFHSPDAGRICLGDEDVTDTPAAKRAIRGLGRSFQEARLFPSLTVTETIAVAHDRHRKNHDWVAASFALPAAVNADADSFERADQLISLLGLDNFASTPIADLSTGTRRIVELACALAMDPAVLLLDEPSAGIAQKDTEALGPLLRQIRAETGAAIVIIEHDMSLLSELCDELVAMENGSVIFSGTPAEVLAHPRVIESYLGVDESAIRRSGTRTPKKKKVSA
ncbi:MAG TPA: ATP-binding cassette domain-containing protein [Acidimicrobiales bacterium]|nr:ATP-binding cassette domain-containing protein [Acidimicrobiales bacterium]